MPERVSQVYLQKAYKKPHYNQSLNNASLPTPPKPNPSVKRSLDRISEDPKRTEIPLPGILQHALHGRPTNRQIRDKSLRLREGVILQDDPWYFFTRLGKLVQKDQILIVCSSKAEPAVMMMFKETRNKIGRQEIELLVQCKHENVIGLRETFEQDSGILLGLEYCPVTLAEVLQTHILLEEAHLRYIASSVSPFRIPSRSSPFGRH